MIIVVAIGTRKHVVDQSTASACKRNFNSKPLAGMIVRNPAVTDAHAVLVISEACDEFEYFLLRFVPGDAITNLQVPGKAMTN